VFKVVASAAGAITIVNPLGVSQTAGGSVTITLISQVVHGTSFTSYTVEKHNQDLTTKEYQRLTGVAWNGLNLSIPNNGVITGTLQTLGANMVIADAAIAGATYNAATNTNVMNGIDNIQAIYIHYPDDSWAKQPATQVDIGFTNNLRARMQIGTLGAISLGLGSINYNGTLRAYHKSGDLIEHYTSFNELGIAVVYRDSAGNYFVQEVPRIKFTSGRVVAGGINTDTLTDLSFQAKLHSTEDTMGRFALDAA
jgi:hypothetical protein